MKISSMNGNRDIVIAATSDIHGFLDNLESEVKSINPDILVIAGDINPCRIDINAQDWFLSHFFPLIKSLDIPVIATPGNHDFWLNRFLSLPDLKQLPGIPSNFHLLCDQEETICGLKFYGTPWVPWINGKWCWEASDETLKYEFSKIPQNVDVLITHSPPWINHELVDISLDHQKSFWRHFGSKDLTQVIREKRPKVSVCGHIHSGQHKGVIIKDDKGDEVCKCYNVSRVNEKYQVHYPLTVLKFKRDANNAEILA